MSATGQPAANTDPLWVPLLTHYRREGSGVTVDAERMAAHVNAVQPAVRQFLLAGSTGDGWEIDPERFAQIVASTRRAGVFGKAANPVWGARPTTEEVVAWAKALERDFAQNGPPAGDFAGIAVCPPIEPEASQEKILSHYEIRARRHRIRGRQCYQLPQVTGCRIGGDDAATSRTSTGHDVQGYQWRGHRGPRRTASERDLGPRRRGRLRGGA